MVFYLQLLYVSDLDKMFSSCDFGFWSGYFFIFLENNYVISIYSKQCVYSFFKMEVGSKLMKVIEFLY